jgi:hypothetical protein
LIMAATMSLSSSAAKVDRSNECWLAINSPIW